jgi:predicted phage tail protein
VNSTGLIFSIEALIAIIILGVAIISISYVEQVQTPHPEYKVLQNQSNRINSFYFDETPNEISTSNKVCGQITYYGEEISTKNICEGYE